MNTCDEMAGDRQDNVRTETVKAVARFMSFSQITCPNRYLQPVDGVAGNDRSDEYDDKS